MPHRPLAAVLGVALLTAACGSDAAETTAERSADPTSTTSPASTSSTTEAPKTPTTTAPPTSTTVPPGPRDVEDASSPAQLAARIVAAETVTRDPAADPAEVQSAAFELQQRYRQLGRTPEWDGPVLASVPGELEPTVTAHAQARREFRGMHSKLSDTLPAWRIVDPPPADELRRYYEEAEATFGVPWEILAAVNLVETGMGRIRGTSVAGAQGPMQFMPATWDAYGMGGDVQDTHDAIMGAANYLAANGGGSGDIDNALWNYNHSWRYVAGVKHYASVMMQDPAAFTGFYHWQVVYVSTIGDLWLPTGYEALERVPVGEYVADHPGRHLGTASN